MSRVTFETETHGVTAGWDRPLSEFFMTVVDLKGEPDEPVWSTIFQPSILEQATIDRLRNILEHELKIPAPEGFWKLVEMREGNVAYFRKGDKWNRHDW